MLAAQGVKLMCLNPTQGLSLTPELPHILPALTVQPQSPASSLAIPAIR